MRQVHAWIGAARPPRLALVDPATPLLVSEPDLPTIRLEDKISEHPACEILECVALGVRVEVHGSITPEIDSLISCFADAGAPLLTRGLKRAVPREVMAEGAMPHDRRSMLGLAGSADLPDLAATDDERLRAALRAIVADHDLDLTSFDRPGPGVRLAATSCIACGVCARSCPTGALTFEDRDTGEDRRISTLSVADGTCTGGLQCVGLCPVSALAVTEPVPWSSFIAPPEPRPLATVPTRRCARCRSFFPVRDGGEYCPTCRARQESPFGVTWPSHVPKPPGLAGL